MSASRACCGAGIREINTGVKPGDMVVVLGMQKIRLGTNPATKQTVPGHGPPIRSQAATPRIAQGPVPPRGHRGFSIVRWKQPEIADR